MKIIIINITTESKPVYTQPMKSIYFIVYIR
jgi:hypothetical protein